MTRTGYAVPRDADAAPPPATALIAEDEPLLARHLEVELAAAWPGLQVLRTCGDGLSAVESALELRPDVMFLDIRMPGCSGLQAAEAIAEDWPEDGRSLPLLVFVTAYEQHAVEAFDRAAADYLLKPLDPARLRRTCERLWSLLATRRPGAPVAPDAIEPALEALRALLQSTAGRLGDPGALAGPAPAGPLTVIPAAGTGSAVHLVPVDDVLVFEAADKYVRVITATGEHLIRVSLRQLQAQLDPQRFWQVHRGTLVRAEAIARAWRDEAGKVTLEVKGLAERIPVSRVYAPRFRPW